MKMEKPASWDKAAVGAATVGAAPHGQEPQRQLLAVIPADVVGYSRLMQVDENDTHSRMVDIRSRIIDPAIASHGGRVVKNTGDGFLAAFPDAIGATRCVIELQEALNAQAAAEPLSRGISFRMGINVADVIVEEHDIFGDGVNIAARLQTYAEPGGIIIADVVAEHIRDRENVELYDLGDLPLRNIDRPVRAFSLRIAGKSVRLLGDALPGTEGRPSIVVLPFREQLSQPGQEYFAEGIVDDIIHALSGLKELFVISRG